MDRKLKFYLTENGFLKIRLTKGGKVKITLEVKAKKLFEYLNTIIPPIEPDYSIVDSYCKLTDDNFGKTNDSKVIDFVSHVYLHKNVKRHRMATGVPHHHRSSIFPLPARLPGRCGKNLFRYKPTHLPAGRGRYTSHWR